MTEHLPYADFAVVTAGSFAGTLAAADDGRKDARHRALALALTVAAALRHVGLMDLNKAHHTLGHSHFQSLVEYVAAMRAASSIHSWNATISSFPFR